MKYIRSIFLFAVISQNLAAQTEQPAVPKQKAFSIGASFMPAVSYRMLIPTSASSKSQADMSNARELPRFGYSAGLHFYIHMNDKLTIETGWLYTVGGFSTNKYALNPGMPDPNLPQYVKYRYNIQYVDIPVKLGMESGNKKFRFCFSAGIMASIVLDYNQTRTSYFANGNETRDEIPINGKYLPVSVSMIIGTGFHYHITKVFSWKMEPQVRVGMVPAGEGPLKEFALGLGVQSVFCFRLTK